MKYSLGLAVVCLGLLLFVSGREIATSESRSGEQDFGVNVTLWNNVLMKYLTEDGSLHGVSLTLVDYKGINSDPDFHEYIKQLEKANITAVEEHRDSIYAFYTNVYNALAIKIIIEHPCKTDLFGKCGKIGSIRDIGTIVPFKEVWGKPAGVVGGKTWSLDDVENYLRDPKPFKEDPRLHASIVCASVSCPNVRKGAFTVDDIEAQLTDNFNNFLGNTKKGMAVDRDNKKVKLSMIFNWFEGDFTGYFNGTLSKPTAIDFILLYLSPSHPDYTWLKTNKDSVSISYFNYNWDINAVKGTVPCSSSSRPCYQLWALVLTLVIIVIVAVIAIIVVCCIRRCRKRSQYHELNTDEH